MDLFVVRPRKLWGDYGPPLHSGYARRDEADGPLLLHRAGPFLPPISFPWISGEYGRLVIEGELRRAIEGSGPPGLAFRRAVKDRVVRLDWHLWDLDGPEPAWFPEGGEPHDYIWDGPHDPAAADAMPDPWELLAPMVPLRIKEKEIEDPVLGYLDRFRAFPDRTDYPPLFLSDPKFGEILNSSPQRGK